MILHLASQDTNNELRSWCPNPSALAGYLLRLMSFYYPNSDPRAMQNLSSYFLTGSREAIRFREFSSFLNFENPILSYCRIITAIGEYGSQQDEQVKLEIRKLVYKVLVFVMKESLRGGFETLRDACPWLFLGFKEELGNPR